MAAPFVTLGDAGSAPAGREPVVLLHGWGMAPWVMRWWAHSLAQAGYAPLCPAWACWREGMEANARLLLERLPLASGQRLHWVGHSLGGLMALQLLARQRDLPCGRVLLVGSPFQGSQVAQRLARHGAGRLLLGHSLRQWAPLHAEQLAPALEIGTIAGTLGLGLGQVFGGLDGPHDGTVTVAETQVPFARDALCLPVSHTGMLWSRQVRAQIVQFLRHGRFSVDGRAQP